jgi:hypothetical protein
MTALEFGDALTGEFDPLPPADVMTCRRARFCEKVME